jgi:hypothetical protein
LVPIPHGRGRHRAAPCGLGPWDGARVASHSRALPSAQVKGIVAATQGLAYGAEQRGGCGDHAAARLSDLSCPRAARDPSRLGQLEMWPGCGGLGQPWPRPAARRVGWSGPDGEEFALDKSASAEAQSPAELPTALVGGTSRRNVLGAIALDKNDCNFPQRSDDDRAGARRRDEGKSAGTTAPHEPEGHVTSARRYQYGITRGRTVSA